MATFLFRVFAPALLLIGSMHSLSAQTIFALSGNTLLSFQANNPAQVTSINPVSGIAPDMNLAGLDCRPATGELYALAYNNLSGEARLYKINPSNAAGAAIGMANIQLQANMGKIGFDFNPTVDRIRVVGSNGANYRLHPVTGAVVATDGSLAFATTDPNAANAPNVGACAYTNSYIGATATTLYNYDDSLNVLLTQIPPNNGTLNTIGIAGISLALGDPKLDLDIYFDASTSLNWAYCVATPGGQTGSMLYTVNLTSGLFTALAPLGTLASIDDITVKIDRSVPAEVSGQLIYCLSSMNNILSCDSEMPENVRNIIAVSGVAAGQVLVGMDFRPATGECFALGYNSMNGESRLYTINLQSGVASAVGMMPFTLDLGNGANVGFDFNPTVDRIRVVAGNNTNYRLNPITGGIAATDSNLAFAIGDINQAIEPAIGAAAYTNSYNTASTTTLYCFDEVLGLLVTQIPPNNGTLNTVGLTGILPNTADPSCDMDIYYDFGTATNIAYCTANPGTGMNDMLYSLNLSSGLATLKGKIGLGIAIRDIAIFPDSLVSVAVKDVVEANPNALSSFPNPASAQFQVNFELAFAADTRILLTDIAGRVVRSIELGKLGAGRQQQSIDLSEVTTGVYFVQLYLENKLQGMNKVIVNK